MNFDLEVHKISGYTDVEVALRFGTKAVVMFFVPEQESIRNKPFGNLIIASLTTLRKRLESLTMEAPQSELDVSVKGRS